MTLDPWRPSWAWTIRNPPPLPGDVETIRLAAKLFQAESAYSKAETLLLEALALAEETPRALQLAGIDRSGPSAEEALEPLQLAIGRGQSVELRYHSLSGGKRQWRRVDPWQLFQRSEAWYLVGYCHRNREPRMFRLDRVGGVRGRQERFAVPRDFDLERFLEDSWGLVVGQESWNIELRFDPSLAPLLLNARHHRGEKVKKLADGSIDYRVKLSSLDEIAAWIVAFGGKCRVVAPPELKEKVEEMARGVLGPPTPPD